FNPSSDSSQQLSLNQPLIAQLIEAASQISGQLPAPAPINPLELLSWPGVLAGGEAQQSDLVKQADQLFGQALAQLKQNRAREGTELRALIEERLDSMAKRVDTRRATMPTLRAAPRAKLIDRFREAKRELNNTRIDQELVVLAQKFDVAEEVDRLTTHINETRNVLVG